MSRLDLRSYASKSALLYGVAAGRSVLHLGAVGETDSDTATRVARPADSVHAELTRIASACVGVDYDQASVRALTESGAFDNLICADVTTLQRSSIPIDRIDVIVAGDTIESTSPTLAPSSTPCTG
jgi:hypothetical protein